jgi:iron complex outermembrane recepter protein
MNSVAVNADSRFAPRGRDDARFASDFAALQQVRIPMSFAAGGGCALEQSHAGFDPGRLFHTAPQPRRRRCKPSRLSLRTAGDFAEETKQIIGFRSSSRMGYRICNKIHIAIVDMPRFRCGENRRWVIVRRACRKAINQISFCTTFSLGAMMKMNHKQLSLAVRHAINAGLVFGLAAPLVHAQQAPATPPVQTLDKVEVTGSRITSATFESASPVNVISAQDIQLTGLQSTANIINQLPQAFADQGGNISNGASGTSTVNLRNLGADRTLVLIDGKRVPAGSPLTYATNLNNIPAPLIKRVEVLTGGASAVYGSDAVAGVVNFIMNDSFEGVQVQYNGSTYQHTQNGSYGNLAARASTNPGQFAVPGDFWGDGTTQNYNILMGSNFANGKGNATIFFQYQNTEALTQKNYNYSACSFGTNGPGDNFACGGSSTASPGRFTNGNTGKSATIVDAAGNVRPFSATLDQFNFGPYNFFQRPQEDYQANVFAHYDLFAGDDKKWMPSVRVYAEFDFTSTTSVAQIAPGGVFYGQFDPLTNDNPLLSQSFKDYFGITADNPLASPLIGRRNTEGGGRNQQFSFNDYRYVLGAKGDFANHAWDYDFWWQSGKNSLSQVTGNYFAADRIQKALNVVKDPTTGRPVCASFLDGTDVNCVPYDIYHNGGVTQAALDYLQVPGIQNGFTQQNVVGLHLTSDLGTAYGWTLPWAKNGVGAAFGVEHRTDRLQNIPDSNLSTANLSGGGGATKSIEGQVTVDEVFAEVKVPIAERQQLAYMLQLDASYRFSDYSNGPQTNSYGVGLEWAPIRGYTLRGSYQQAVRAANIIELFQQQGNNLYGGQDPCATQSNGTGPTATLAQCLRTGLAANLYGSQVLDSPAGQYNFLQGGNPNLTPEKSDSYTVGLVLDQPFKGFSATIDYWNIKVKNNIGIVTPQDKLNQCVATGAFCGDIHRDNLGTLWLDGGGFVTATNENLGTTSTSGIDLTANYTLPITNYGSLLFTFQGTYLDTFVNQPLPGGPTYDCVGLYGTVCGTPAPRWRSNVRVLWSTPWNIDAGITWRYFDSVKVDATSSNPSLAGSTEPITSKLGSRNYIDLVATWQIDKNWLVRGGVNNVFDKDPPITSTTLSDPSFFGNGNTFPQVYDALGRLFFVNVTAKF